MVRWWPEQHGSGVAADRVLLQGRTWYRSPEPAQVSAWTEKERKNKISHADRKREEGGGARGGEREDTAGWVDPNGGWL